MSERRMLITEIDCWLDGILLRLIATLPARLRKPLASRFLEAVRYRERPGYYRLRVNALALLGASIGTDVRIKAGVIIEYPENMEIGDRVSIQQRCFLSCYGGLHIGNDVSIAHDVSIVTSTHPMDFPGTIREAPLSSAPVRIGSNVWLGMKAMVLAGVTIGSDVVVGAGSLVNEDIPANSIAYGLPARVRKTLYTDAGRGTT